MTLLFLLLLALPVGANPVRWDPNILSSPLSNAGFSQTNVRRINDHARRALPEGEDIRRLTVRDLVSMQELPPYHSLRNEIHERLAELGLTLRMSEEEIRLFEKEPDHILFQPLNALADDISESGLSSLRGTSRSRNPRSLLILDLVKAQSQRIPGSLPRIPDAEQVQVAQVLDRKLGTDTALNLSRYGLSSDLVERLAEKEVYTILDLLNAPEAVLLGKNAFLSFDEVVRAKELRWQFRGLIDPNCDDRLRRYGYDDEVNGP